MEVGPFITKLGEDAVKMLLFRSISIRERLERKVFACIGLAVRLGNERRSLLNYVEKATLKGGL